MIRTERVGTVGVVTLDRPGRRNALGTELVRGLSASLRRFDVDSEVAAMVITGAPPAFCAGSDLKALAALSTEGMCEHELGNAAVVRSIGNLTKPVVAAVEGYALGGGFMLALGCDVVVSAVNARWHLPEVTNGWIPIWGMHSLVARVGPARARQLSWGAGDMDGQEAKRWGVVDHLAEPGEALSRALQIASALAALPAEAVRSVKAFYRSIVLNEAERFDALACAAFARDSMTPAAQATFIRYR